MEVSRVQDLNVKFSKVMEAFSEILQKDIKADSAYLDASIQRFEFCYELCWKYLRSLLLDKGIQTNNPRDTFKEAFRQGWLKSGDDAWSLLIKDRNLTVHTYDQRTAEDIYSRLKDHKKIFEEVLSNTGI